ncbi:MAG: diacylglycerol kinase family protein [Planctomycetota bacterium]|nr:diacylglycerol kinase family protein [Planctomycetota bacterium]
MADVPAGPVVLIGQNPTAGSGAQAVRIEQLVEALKLHQLEPRIIPDRDELVSLARQHLADGSLRCVVAAGGDGTVNALLNRTPAGTPIAILPCGTENLLAKHLGIPIDPVQVGRVIADGNSICLDAGQANGQLFLLMLGCGFDAEAVHQMHAMRSGPIRHWSWIKPIWQTLCRYRFPEVTVQYRAASGGKSSDSDLTTTLTTRWVFISNLPCYARKLSLSPDADGFDGQLDLCAYNGGSVWSALRFLFGVIRRQHSQLPGCVTDRGSSFQLQSSAKVPFQLDGDPGGYLPVTVTIVPRRATLLVPASPVSVD